jgi:hypothetical protein
MFRYEFGFGHDVSRLSTRLTTLRGRLPQGAPTSTAIANLVLSLPLDRPMTAKTRRLKTRFGRLLMTLRCQGRTPGP